MRHRPTKRAAAPATTDRPPLALVRDVLPEVIANAAKIDPTILDDTPPPHSIPVKHQSEPPYRTTREPGKLEVWENLDGQDTNRYVYVDPLTRGYHIHILPANGINAEVDDLLVQITHAVARAQMAYLEDQQRLTTPHGE